MFVWVCALAAVVWIAVVLLPWRPWSTRERLKLAAAADALSLDKISVLIPARNEATCIATTLTKLDQQGRFAAIFLVDDQSDDGTGDIARGVALEELRVIDGAPPAANWSGKLWALQQALEHVDSRYVLLLDADIGLRPGVVSALLAHLERNDLDMASVMANLHMQTMWEKLLLPPFIYFFKLIYPFALANSHRSFVAAGAGGCVLLKTSSLTAIGGFAALRGAIIDDCTLAKKIKALPGRIWIGLSNDARALRPYENLDNIWNMVARTAYTQLRYSPALLLVCTALLVLSYIVPIVGLFATDSNAVALSVIALCAMCATFLPTVRYYDLSPLWTLTLPFAAVLFLAMTWTSAIRYARGERSRWKDRSYEVV